MTCIAAVKEKGNVYMGADSCCTIGDQLCTMKDPKIFIRDGIIIGSAGAVRPSQVLEFSYLIPSLDPKEDLDSWLYNQFIPGFQESLRDQENLKSSEGQSSQEAWFLLGVRGRIFQIFDEFDVVESKDNYHAIGSGGPVATGVLFATEGSKIKPKDRITLALQAAEYHCAGVRGPFHFGSVSCSSTPTTKK